jgi:hypothetical protein
MIIGEGLKLRQPLFFFSRKHLHKLHVDFINISDTDEGIVQK